MMSLHHGIAVPKAQWRFSMRVKSSVHGHRPRRASC
jgi:hypothetical protein